MEEEKKESEEPIVPYTIPANMINACEKHYKFDLTPLSMKKIVNNKMALVNRRGLELEENETNYKIWLNKDGHSFNEDAPIIESETYFPFIDNPLVVLHCILNTRKDWDMDKNKSLVEIKKHRGPQFKV